MGLKFSWNQTQSIMEFHSFPPATLSDPVTLMPTEPGVLINHVPSGLTRESKAWIKTEALGMVRCLFSQHCGKEKKKTTWMQECLNAESEDIDKCKIFKVIFRTVAEGLSQCKLLRLFAISKQWNTLHMHLQTDNVLVLNRRKPPL